jgi:alanyl-tRNA synthetase
MMTSTQIRKSFLDFFQSKDHSIVPSSPLLPDSPNLLFTNAGMNQFVPIFLGQRKPDVGKWAGADPRLHTRAADTQKCIRAGGKHNDLDDVGLDTYHHTFFEMLGNWSFGDYFKKEAIDWAWELVVEEWRFPPARLYATVFCPYLGEPDWEKKWRTELEQVVSLAMVSSVFIPPNPDASPFEIADQEAALYWVKKFIAANLDPFLHVIPGNRKDNFWMMGDTGPCGPCSELHVDLTPAGDTGGALVNQGDARCIEIWNLVFIQFNANPDGTFVNLPAKHVDTGMGFERVTSIIQGTKNLSDFANAKISNYETDIFRPIFDALEQLSGKKYGSTLPAPPPAAPPPAGPEANAGAVEPGGPGAAPARPPAVDEQIQIDIAFRVIADHIRTLSFAIADGIQPSNTDRGYVLRRILRRAVRYGRSLGFHAPFFYRLVDVLAETMGDVFPEIRARKDQVQAAIRAEEEGFNKTLDNGIELFETTVFQSAIMNAASHEGVVANCSVPKLGKSGNPAVEFIEFQRAGRSLGTFSLKALLEGAWRNIFQAAPVISGEDAFKLYDTYGFPLDLTELMAHERGLTVDRTGFDRLMGEQRERSKSGIVKEVISVSQVKSGAPTRFVGFDKLESTAWVIDVVDVKGKSAVVFDETVFYAEMGGQVGDTGRLLAGNQGLDVVGTQKVGNTFVHLLGEARALPAGSEVKLFVDRRRRQAIQRHHTVTHLLHWALHEVVSGDASQKGSFVGPDKLTFDFNSPPLTAQQVADVEKVVNERILENAGVTWSEVPYAEVKNRRDVMQFFGDKYGDTVRVVQVGGRPGELNGYSMELCGGTHTRATGEIGLFRIVGENAIAAGVRRIEAVAGLEAYRKANDEVQLIRALAGKVNSPVHELEKKIESLVAQQKELEKEVKIAMQRNASNAASELLGHAQNAKGIPLITHNLGVADGDFLQAIADALKGRFKGVVVLGGAAGGAVALVAAVSPEFTGKIQAGKIIQQIAPIIGGKGGGKPDNARGGGKDATKLDEALAQVQSLW